MVEVHYLPKYASKRARTVVQVWGLVSRRHGTSGCRGPWTLTTLAKTRQL
jgi:hypothetical protein